MTISNGASTVTHWHQWPIDELYHQLQSSATGLTTTEALARRQQVGPNSLPEIRQVPLWRHFISQFTHFLALLLWVSILLCFVANAINPASDMLPIGVAILGVLLINGGFSFFQEYKAEKTLQALQELLPQKCWVIRDGQSVKILVKDVVPGDLLLLQEGEQVAADARVIHTSDLQINISSLTGEAMPVMLSPDPVARENPWQAPNLVYAGTFVVKGEGQALVYATGVHTAYGRIAMLSQQTESVMGHIQREIEHTTRIISLIAMAMGVVLMALGSLQGFNLWTTFVFALGIIVANVPEGLLPTVTLALAMGTQRMARRQFLVRNLNVIENLGAITVIATDKTGTLTQNEMVIEGIFDNQAVLSHKNQLSPILLRILNYCHNVASGSQDPVELAMVHFIEQNGYRQAPQTRLQEYPFDYHLRRMTVIMQGKTQVEVLTKGAFASVLGVCQFLQLPTGQQPLTPELRQWLQERHDQLAAGGFRLLGLAYKLSPTWQMGREWAEQDLTFTGMMALVDPLRDGIKEAVQKCKDAGIRVMMITGDNPLTAAAIAQEAGIIDSHQQVITAEKLQQGTPEDLHDFLHHNGVIAQATPEDKLRVVNLLQAMGETIAVTGDGVNDAPALKKADVGIAMGSGTAVAREVADAILLNDHFATIIDGIEEGRTVFANIQKFITYILASNVPEIVPYIAYFLWGWPLALTVPQILAIDLGTDLLPALALGTEKPEDNVMKRPPRDKDEKLLNPALFMRAYLFLGVIEAVASMAIFMSYLFAHGFTWGTTLALKDPLYLGATTMALAAIVFCQIGNGFACRSETTPIWRMNILGNRFYLAGIVYELVVLLMLVLVPFLQPIFSTHIPDLTWLPWLAVMPLGLLVVEEARKAIVRRQQRPTNS